MKEDAVREWWSFGCTVLRNARKDMDKHRRVEEKHCLPLEDIMDVAGWREAVSYRSRAFESHCSWVVCFMGKDIEFSSRALIRALARLDERCRRIVLLYYALEKTDEEIRHLLGMRNRSLVQYHRKEAIKKMRAWMREMEDDVHELL